MYTLTQVECHRALTTNFSKASGDSSWSPTRWIHWCLAHCTCFAEKWRNVFQFSSIPIEYRHGPYERRLKNCFKDWCLVRPSMLLRHMHHCMSMNALEQSHSSGEDLPTLIGPRGVIFMETVLQKFPQFLEGGRRPLVVSAFGVSCGQDPSIGGVGVAFRQKWYKFVRMSYEIRTIFVTKVPL